MSDAEKEQERKAQAKVQLYKVLGSPPQEIYHSPNQTNEDSGTTVSIIQPEPKPSKMKKARFLFFSRKGIKVSQEHIHSPQTFKVTFCKDCGEFLGGEKQH